MHESKVGIFAENFQQNLRRIFFIGRKLNSEQLSKVSTTDNTEPVSSIYEIQPV